VDGMGFLFPLSLFCSIRTNRRGHATPSSGSDGLRLLQWPSAPTDVEVLVHRVQTLLLNVYECHKRSHSACDTRVREHADHDAPENDGNLRCESRMDRKSFWSWSQISERIASDEC
jgi:hypothetical protein